jgi:hypothetical protein
MKGFQMKIMAVQITQQDIVKAWDAYLNEPQPSLRHHKYSKYLSLKRAREMFDPNDMQRYDVDRNAD